MAPKHKISLKWRVIFLVLMCLTVSCAPAGEREIQGTYVFENSVEKEVIVLAPDNTYTRTLFIKSSGDSSQETGTWHYFDRFAQVSLDHVDPKDPTKTVGSGKAIEKWFGRLYLGMAEDGGRQYTKTD